MITLGTICYTQKFCNCSVLCFFVCFFLLLSLCFWKQRESVSHRLYLYLSLLNLSIDCCTRLILSYLIHIPCFNTISIVSITLLIHDLHVILKLTFYAILYQMNQTLSWLFFFPRWPLLLLLLLKQMSNECVIGSFSEFEFFLAPGQVLDSIFDTDHLIVFESMCSRSKNSGSLLSSTSIMHILYWSEKNKPKFFFRSNSIFIEKGFTTTHFQRVLCLPFFYRT